VQERYTLCAHRTFSQVHTRLTGSTIRDNGVVLKYVKGNLESSHAVVCGEVEVQSDAFLDLTYRGADKSLARPGRKQARKHVRDASDFSNFETRAVMKFFFSPCKARRRRKFTPL